MYKSALLPGVRLNVLDEGRGTTLLFVHGFPLSHAMWQGQRVLGDRYRVIGELTIRDATREVALDVEAAGQGTDPWGNERIGFAAKTSIDREDWDMTWNMVVETGGFLVSKRIDIEIETELQFAG